MLNIAPLAAGQQEYYLALAKADDYYLGKAEAPGVWIGSGRVHLDLDGLVDDGDLRALLSLRDPATGARLNRAKMPGYDLAFRAPKSVSILYALGEPGVITGEVVAAHDEAVRQALTYLEGHACATRYRVDGEVTPVKATGFVAAAFRHRTSRAADPLVHTHVLVANAAQDAGGRWGALDGTLLFRHSLPAGYVYQAVLRSELTRRLGVSWEPVVNGVADIAGIPRGLIERFSKRRRAILELLTMRGETSARAAQIATLATRQPKDHPLDEAALRRQWREEAEHFGFGENDVAALLAHTAAARRQPRTPEREGLFLALASPDGLTRKRATFDRRDVVKAVCSALPEGGSLHDVEALVDDFLAHNEVVPLGAMDDVAIRRSDGRTVLAATQRYTTVEMLRTEAEFLVRAAAHSATSTTQVEVGALDRVLADSVGLTDEQRAMARRLCGDANGLCVVVGVAGSGKTRALGTARAAWEASGGTVVGCALSARAASELEAGSGTPAMTIARFLRRAAERALPPRSVVVVDEAGMVGTRLLSRLLAIAERDRAKLVLVGDHQQLPELEAGGAFGMLASELGAVTLSENRRQAQAWERQALDRLRRGDAVLSTQAYWRRQLLTFHETGFDAKRCLVDQWWRSRERGLQVGMVALRRQDVRDLNELARARMLSAGRIMGPTMRVGGHEFGVGDEIVALRNAYNLGVLNGDRGIVVAVDPHGRFMDFACERNASSIRLPYDYAASRHVDHGYALTIHKTQGATFEQCLVLVDDGMYRQAAYTGLSRGVDGNAMFAVDDLVDDPHRSDDPDPPEEWDQVRSVMAHLSVDRSQSMALEQLGPERKARLVRRLAAILTAPEPPTGESATPEPDGMEVEIDLPDFGP